MTTDSASTAIATDAKIGRRLDARPTARRADAYPWTHWENGEWWLIKRGDQFRCTPAGMRSTLRSRAAKNGVFVDVVLRPDDPQVPREKNTNTSRFASALAREAIEIAAVVTSALRAVVIGSSRPHA